MILMTIPHLKIGVSPMVEMLRVKTFPSTLWGMNPGLLLGSQELYQCSYLDKLKLEAGYEDHMIMEDNFTI